MAGPTVSDLKRTLELEKFLVDSELHESKEERRLPREKRSFNDLGRLGDKNHKSMFTPHIYEEKLSIGSTKEDIFQSVGVPLVRNALAGYNTSILSYGQSGSGKTYTMWGPPSAMFEEPPSQSHKGIVPRIFQMLFSELEREQLISEGKQFNYQCQCCFLEMKDYLKNGLYIENLTEEYVTSYDDMTQFLIKGFSSRKVGATSLNSKSSRPHIIFTFVIESWCKDYFELLQEFMSAVKQNHGEKVFVQVARVHF